MDVCFYEAFAEEVAALRRHLPGQLRVGFTDRTIQESGDPAPPATLISIRTQSILPFTWPKTLRGIISRTTGYDHLVACPVACGYLPEYCARAVAEQAALLWLALLRRLPEQLAHFARFDRDGLTGAECAGKNLLVVGVGHIGSEVVRIGVGLGMDVRGVDILQKYPGVEYVPLEEGLPWADVLVCAMNLTADNCRYFRHEVLERARSGVILVNIARGEFTPTADMVRLLDAGRLGGLALDVYENEAELAGRLRAGGDRFALAGRPNVILTPHNAFNTHEAVERKARQTVEQLEHFFEHQRFLWPVPR